MHFLFSFIMQELFSLGTVFVRFTLVRIAESEVIRFTDKEWKWGWHINAEQQAKEKHNIMDTYCNITFNFYLQIGYYAFFYFCLLLFTNNRCMCEIQKPKEIQ